MKLIILDKSFIDRSEAASEMVELSKNANLVMTDSLFYELITTKKQSLQRCFRNFPDTQNPVIIVELEKLFNFEIKNNSPFGELSMYALNENYSFNKRLREGTFIFEGNVKKDKEKWEERTKKKTEDFIARCLSVHEFFPELKGVPWHGRDFSVEIDKAKHKVAEDETFIRNICTNIFKNIPVNINKNWFLFRLIQCQILYALNFFCKWQGQFPKEVGEKFYLRMEHTMIDSEYVIIGSLTGSIATLDKEVRKNFRMVYPHGELIPDKSLHK